MASPQELSNEDLAKALNQRQQPMAWSDVATQAVQNIPSSGMNFVTNTLQPFLHPIQTAETFYDIGRGLLDKAGLVNDPDAEAKVNAIGQFFADRYGSVENLKKTIAEDPVGVAADAAAILTGGAALAGKMGLTGTSAALRTAGQVVDPLYLAGRAAKVAGTAASPLLGLSTGAGGKAIREAAKVGASTSPTASAERATFTKFMRGRGTATELSGTAKRALGTMKAEAQRTYRINKAALAKDKSIIDLTPALKEYLNLVDEYVTPGGFVASPETVATLDHIQKTLIAFRNEPLTPISVDGLKRALGNIVDHLPPGTEEYRAATIMTKGVRQAIIDQAPEYAKMMEAYAGPTEMTRELEKTFSLGNKATTDTASRKLLSSLRNNVNANFGERERLASELAKREPTLMPGLAGQTLSSPTPRGIQGAIAGAGGATGIGLTAAGALNPTALLAIGGTAATTSPRIVGEAAYKAGQAARVAPKLAAPARAAQQIGRAANINQPTPPSSDLQNLSDEDLRRALNAR